MQRNSKPLSWKFKGVSDAIDATNIFNGAMMALTNLVPDPSTRDLWQCRPAATLLTALGGLGDPFSSGFSSGFGAGASIGFISCYKVVGNFLYGMGASGTLLGQDVPFCINLTNGAIVAVSGSVTTTTTPASPPVTGTWIPPQMDVIGVKLMVAHSGFTGVGGNFIGWFDITNPSAPVWHAGNLTGLVAFTIAPVAVKQFGNRAYYIHNNPIQPAVIFSDVLNATNATNANQILTFNDNVPLTALGALPLTNQLGGIIQSIMVFKNVTAIFQILGDAAASTLSVNALNVATGTLSPNSICATSQGLAFASPDGIRIIDFNANVGPPIGQAGDGVTVPFIYSAVPSRIAAACNGMVLRVTTQNANANGNPQQDYWYDFGRKVWSGPHTFPASLIAPYQGTFIMTPIGVSSSIWKSDPVQTSLSVFTENGAALSWAAQTMLLPDTDLMTSNAMTETTLDLSLPSNIAPVSVVAADQFGAVLASAVLVPPPASGAPTIWGQFTWGSATWSGGQAAALAPYFVPWALVLVFARLIIKATGVCATGFKLGTLHLRYQPLQVLVNISPPFRPPDPPAPPPVTPPVVLDAYTDHFGTYNLFGGSQGPYWVNQNVWNLSGLTPGQYSQTISIPPATFPQGIVVQWAYPAIPNAGNVWSYPEIVFGSQAGGGFIVPPHTPPAQQINTFTALSVTYNIALSMSTPDDTDVLIETWVQTIPGNPGSNVNEVGFYVYAPAGNAGQILGFPNHFNFSAGGFNAYIGANAGFSFIAIMPVTAPGGTTPLNLSSGTHTLPILAVLQALVANGYISGTNFISGFEFGFEISRNNGVATINQLAWTWL